MLPDVFGPANRVRCLAQLQKFHGYKFLPKPIAPAAVLIPLCIVRNVPGILFLRRPMHLRLHAGEVSFPGGKCDPNDKGDVVRTALRETFEEIGLAPESIDVWSQLPRMDNHTTLYPVLGFCGHIELPELEEPKDFSEQVLASSDSVGRPHRLKLNKSEVSYVLFRSFEWLCNLNNISYTEFRLHSSYFSLPHDSSEWDRSISKHDIRADQLRIRLPVYGGTDSATPRIWGLTSWMTYKALQCLIPDGAYPPDSFIARRLWRLNQKIPIITDDS